MTTDRKWALALCWFAAAFAGVTAGAFAAADNAAVHVGLFIACASFALASAAGWYSTWADEA